MKQMVTSRIGRHGGQTNGQTIAHGRSLEPCGTSTTCSQAPSERRQTSRPQPQCPDRHPVRAQNRDWMGRLATRDGLRKWNDMLATPARLAGSWRLGPLACHVIGAPQRGRPDRLVACHRRQQFRTGGFWGAKTGPNPTDRGKNGSKHHAITDANGIPLAALLTEANRNDVTQLLPLVDAIPSVRGKAGHPRHRPDVVQGDRGYDSEGHRHSLRARGIMPLIARRRTANGSGLGVTRWVIERTLSWLHQFRRLRVRYERRSDIHESFLTIGCCLICWRFLEKRFC